MTANKDTTAIMILLPSYIDGLCQKLIFVQSLNLESAAESSFSGLLDRHWTELWKAQEMLIVEFIFTVNQMIYFKLDIVRLSQ